MRNAENRFSFLRGFFQTNITHEERHIEQQIADILGRYGAEGLQLYHRALHVGYTRRRILAILATGGGSALLSGCMEALQTGKEPSISNWHPPQAPTARVEPGAAYANLTPQAASQPLPTAFAQPVLQPTPLPTIQTAVQPQSLPPSQPAPSIDTPQQVSVPLEDWEAALPPEGRERNIGDEDGLDRFNNGATLLERFSKGDVAYYAKPHANGTLRYVVAHLNPGVKFAVSTANGIKPQSSDAGTHEIAGWEGGIQGNYQWINEMFNASQDRYAHEGLQLAALMNGTYHNEFSQIEGVVMNDGEVESGQPNRMSLKFMPDMRTAWIGFYNRAGLSDAYAAIGGGPVLIAPGERGRPKRVVVGLTDEWGNAVLETEQHLRWNPFNEDFVKSDELSQQYTSFYRNSSLTLGRRGDGRVFVMMVTGDGGTMAQQVMDELLTMNELNADGSFKSGVQYALRMDGGKSTGIEVRNRVKDPNATSHQFICSALGVYCRP